MNTPIKQLIKELNDREEFPRAAIEQLLARPAESTPALLELIQDPAQVYTTSLDDLEDAGLWALFLLAHFREPKAFHLLLQLLEYPHEDFDDFWGDLALEVVGRFLASTYKGDFAALRSLAHNTVVHYIACSCAIEAIGLLYYHGHISRAALLDELQQLKQRHCSDENMQGVIFVTIVSIVYDYQIEELRPWLEKEATTKEMNIYDHEELRERFALSPEKLQEVLKEDPHHALITDPIELIEFWWNNCNSPEDSEWDEPEIPEPYQRESPKVGRNDPCPCGSGKKHKKCCG